MNDNTNQNNQQQTTTPTLEVEGGAGRMFTQDEVNKIVSDRLARERERLAGDSEYRQKYESVLAELNGLKAAQARQAKEDAYRSLLQQASISEKRIPIMMRASSAEIDALELGNDGKVCGAEKLIESIKNDWADFVVTTEIRGADTPNPPCHYAQTNDDDIKNAFRPKI